jgi:hypothetical protein
MRIKSLRNMLVDGDHVGEGWIVEVDDTTASTLIHMHKAVVAGEDDVDVREDDDIDAPDEDKDDDIDTPDDDKDDDK